MKFLIAVFYFSFMVSSMMSGCAADIASKLTDDVFQFESSAQGVRKEISFALRTIASKPRGKKLLELIDKLFGTYALIYPGSKVLIGIGDKLEFFPTHPDDSPEVRSQLLKGVESMTAQIDTEIACTNKVLEQHRQQLLELRDGLLENCKEVLRKDTVERLRNLKGFLIDVHLAIIQARNDLNKVTDLSDSQKTIFANVKTLLDKIKEAKQFKTKTFLPLPQNTVLSQKNFQQNSISKEDSLSQARNLYISITQNSLNGGEKSESVVRIIENKIPSKSKVYIEMIQTPFFILFVHELIHMKHFLEEKCSKQINLNLIKNI